MKLNEISELLNEVPLPPDWDKERVSPRTSFAKMLQYAKERAKKIGAGSSRVAFEIPFEGRPTILKIAKNIKGLAQNKFESSLMHDYYLKNLNIVIPGIDYDEENDPPRWIHMEKAEKVKLAQFKKYFGIDPEGLFELAKAKYRGNTSKNPTHEELYEKNENVQNFVDFADNFDMIAIADFSRLANWGVYNGNVVIVDVGGSSEIIQQFYR